MNGDPFAGLRCPECSGLLATAGLHTSNERLECRHCGTVRPLERVDLDVDLEPEPEPDGPVIAFTSTEIVYLKRLVAARLSKRPTSAPAAALLAKLDQLERFIDDHGTEGPRP